jgi:hypothetical protein
VGHKTDAGVNLYDYDKCMEWCEQNMPRPAAAEKAIGKILHISLTPPTHTPGYLSLPLSFPSLPHHHSPSPLDC